MIAYLIKRPIAVLSISFALLILGWISLQQLPVSLMSDIEIPRISVVINYPGHSAGEIENNIVKPLRAVFARTPHLKNMDTRTQDGNAIIKLNFEFGTRTGYAFLQVNEKIDASINQLPKDLPLPKVIKATASDIPVYNLILHSKQKPNTSAFLQMSDFAREVIKKRIEQLPDVAIADMSGDLKPEINIEIKPGVLQTYGIKPDLITQIIKKHNYVPGNLLVQNGIYQYHLKFDKSLNNIDDLKNLPVNIHGKLFKLKDLAKISVQPRQSLGNIIYNGQPAISFLIVKQADAKISRLKKQVLQLTDALINDYPQLDFHIEQDQSRLIEISLQNLKSSLIIGTVLAILILFFFQKDTLSPLIIAVSIPISLILTFLFLHLWHISLNIISLSGLILGVGMMIDNAIIVIDNILQKLKSGQDLDKAVDKGTTEIIAPLLSSMLTTVSVFLPLIYLSGITGALFYDQAISVAMGLFSSFLVSIIVIPVLFRLLYHLKKNKTQTTTSTIENYYDKTHSYFIKRKIITLGIAGLGIFLMFFLFNNLHKQKLPFFKETETLVDVNWNENISLQENEKRLTHLLNQIKGISTYIIWTGQPDYLIQNNQNKSLEQSRIYIKTKNSQTLQKVKKQLSELFKKQAPAQINFLPPPNVFQYIFENNQPQLVVKLVRSGFDKLPPVQQLPDIQNSLGLPIAQIPLQKAMAIEISAEKLALYDVNYRQLVNALQAAFQTHYIDHLKTQKKYIPIVMSYPKPNIKNIIQSLYISNNSGQQIPVKALVKLNQVAYYKFINGDANSEFLSFALNGLNNPAQKIQSLQTEIRKIPEYGLRFSGSYFEKQQLGKELWQVILIALLLLYFIMVAQFESFWQPFIILLEIPIDIGFGLLFLWLFGSSINIMAIIGIVVMSGVVINDSILKIYTINSLRKQGLPIDMAVKQGGRLRFKAILMTSLTTILALVPFLFINGLGAELQRPLALTVIGSMLFGTFISLYFLPLIYKLSAQLLHK